MFNRRSPSEYGFWCGTWGLVFYIETKKHKVLFDVGQSALFLSNAHRLNIDIQKVDTLVISHGHYDHGGGLEDF